MKSCILVLSLFAMAHAMAQPPGKKYTFWEIGWSIVLPADFTAFPSADQSVQIQPGRKYDNQSLSKRLLTAMKDANLIAVNLTSCDAHDEDADAAFTAYSKRAYAGWSKQKDVQCDSATTTVSIDGVSFRRFRITVKKNNLVQENNVGLHTCYKGYAISISLLFFDKKTGEELESMLEHSKFGVAETH